MNSDFSLNESIITKETESTSLSVTEREREAERAESHTGRARMLQSGADGGRGGTYVEPQQGPVRVTAPGPPAQVLVRRVEQHEGRGEHGRFGRR